MNKEKLISALFEQTRTRIKEDDPIFALVALNESVMTEAIAHMNRITNGIDTKLQPTLDSLTTVLGSIIEHTQETEKKLEAYFTAFRQNQTGKLASDYQQTVAELRKHVGSAIREEISLNVNAKALGGITSQVEKIETLVTEVNNAVGALKGAKDQFNDIATEATKSAMKAITNQARTELNHVKLRWWQLVVGIFFSILVSSVFTIFMAHWLGIVVTRGEMQQMISKPVQSGSSDFTEPAVKASVRRK